MNKRSDYCEEGQHQVAPKGGCSTSWCQCSCHDPFRTQDDVVTEFSRQIEAGETAKAAVNALDAAEEHLTMVERIAAALAGSDFDVSISRDGRPLPAGHVPYALALVFRVTQARGTAPGEPT